MKFPLWLPVYGDKGFRGKCPTETLEQVTFFNVIRKEMGIALHIKNEGKRTIHQVMKDKAEGLTAGASDIIIPGNPTFVCELKRMDHTKSVWQPKQIEFLQECHDNGAFVCVALGYKAALEAVKEWKK